MDYASGENYASGDHAAGGVQSVDREVQVGISYTCK
jgi:hypothetical protein